MKIKEIYELNEGLKAIVDKELPIKMAFLIQKNMSMMEDEIKNAEVIRQKIIKKYEDEEATKNLKEQGVVQLQKDKLEDFNKEINELMGQEIDVELKKISIDDLDGITIKPVDLNRLRYIIED